ncbi:hypothetical protein BDQ17DRAFT_44017 [Cyathus striatus]|nr:hypothetical protein BDQ17DRAFT_44017 [Cyathus striatus]
MSTTTMHFGPEWMRTKHQPLARSSQQPPSPPPTSATSTYSALLSSVPPCTHPEMRDEAHPFRYSKEELLRIYKEGGGKGGLGLEVERWEGVVREIGSDPIGVRELSEAEKKLFSGPLNSDLRRRQSTDYLSPLNTNSLGAERPRLNHNTSSNAGSPLRERFGALKRRESSDSTTAAVPRKQSLSSLQAPLMSPRDSGLPSPRTRVGYTPSFDGVLNTGESWSSRRRTSETSVKQTGAGGSRDGVENYIDEKDAGILEEKEEDENGHRSQHLMTLDPTVITNNEAQSLADGNGHTQGHDVNNVTTRLAHLSISSEPVGSASSQPGSPRSAGPHPGFQDLGAVEWSYKDPSGQIQGPFCADVMQKWYDEGYFTLDLPMKRTHLDTQWMTVEELVHRAGGDRIFLSPIVPVVPPGLGRQNGSPMQTFVSSDQNVFGDPYQPAPVRNLRSSTLDSYLSNGSNHSESPSSSLGTGRFGESPEPSGFGGRAGTNTNPYFSPDPSGIGRVSAFAPGMDVTSSFGVRRGVFADPTLDVRTTSYGNIVRGSAMDVYSYTSQHNSSTGPWNQPRQLTPGFDQSEAISFSSFASGSAIPSVNETYSNNRNDSDVGNGFPSTMHYSGGSSIMNQHASSYATFGSIDQSIMQEDQQYPHSPVHALPPQQYNSTSSPFNAQAATQSAASLPTNSQAPWTPTVEPQIRRPGPFESAHPTAANTIIIPSTTVPPSQPSPWNRAPQSPRPSSQTKESSPWLASSQGIVEETWVEQPGVNSEIIAASTHSTKEEENISSTPSIFVGTVEPEQVVEVPASVQSEPDPVPSRTERSKVSCC